MCTGQEYLKPENLLKIKSLNLVTGSCNYFKKYYFYELFETKYFHIKKSDSGIK